MKSRPSWSLINFSRKLTTYSKPRLLQHQIAEDVKPDIAQRYAKSMLGVYKRPPLVLCRGEGCYVHDHEDTKPYLDLTSGIAVNALGHAHPAVLAAINDQAKKLIHTSNLFHTVPPIKLAEKLLMSLQRNDDQHYWEDGKVFFCNSGTESVEAAVKFARRYGMADGKGKYKVISMQNGFHGRTMGALSATPTEKYQAPFMPLVPGFKHAMMNDLESVKQKMDSDTCAIIVEPIQGEGGILPANLEFLRGLRELCDENDALLIMDEIQCGLGRTGELWAHRLYPGVHPDIITLAKPLANGLPIGATILRSKVADHVHPGDHGTTFGGNPFVCAVAIAVLQTIDQPFFLRRVKKVGGMFVNKLEHLKTQFPELIQDVRGCGLMIGMEMKSAGMNDEFVEKCRDKRLLVLTAGNNVVRILPPLIIDTEDVELALDTFQRVLLEMSKNR